MISIPSPIPLNYKIEFAHDGLGVVHGHRLYQRIDSVVSQVGGDLTPTGRQFTLPANLPTGPREFFVRSFNAVGESGDSNAIEVQVGVPPNAPTGTTLVIL